MVNPSPGTLASIDDDAPEGEEEPMSEYLSVEEQEAAEKNRAARQALIQKRKRVCLLFISKGDVLLSKCDLVANHKLVLLPSHEVQQHRSQIL